MKTTDLIPLILYQLADGDKYGYEIVKQIEDSSNGVITIKQPTLYSLLKKLEQGKFITSYWQDSEIGGKRHYYKLTDNGKSQLDTYPAFEQIVADICGEQSPIASVARAESSPAAEIENIITEQTEQVSDIITIDVAQVDNSTNSIEVIPESFEEVVKPIKIDLTTNISPVDSFIDEIPTESVSGSDFDIEESVKPASAPTINIFDAIKPAEITTSEDKSINLDTAKNEESKQESVLSQMEQIKQPKVIAEKPIVSAPIPNKLYNKLTPTDMMQGDATNLKFDKEVIDKIINTPIPSGTTEKVSYLDYVDMTTDSTTLERKRVLFKHIQKMLATCCTLLIMLVLSLALVSKYSFSSLYYAFICLSVLILVFYPIILFRNLSKLRLQYCSEPFKYSILRDLFVKLSMFLILAITVLAYNISIVENVKIIFALSNCANFIAPLMLSLVVMLDFVYNILFFKKHRK